MIVLAHICQEHKEYLIKNRYDAENIKHYMRIAQWVEELDVSRVTKE
jgi:hypothetical protein